jgi:hypothetical protein
LCEDINKVFQGVGAKSAQISLHNRQKYFASSPLMQIRHKDCQNVYEIAPVKANVK